MELIYERLLAEMDKGLDGRKLRLLQKHLPSTLFTLREGGTVHYRLESLAEKGGKLVVTVAAWGVVSEGRDLKEHTEGLHYLGGTDYGGLLRNAFLRECSRYTKAVGIPDQDVSVSVRYEHHRQSPEMLAEQAEVNKLNERVLHKYVTYLFRETNADCVFVRYIDSGLTKHVQVNIYTNSPKEVKKSIHVLNNYFNLRCDYLVTDTDDTATDEQWLNFAEELSRQNNRPYYAATKSGKTHSNRLPELLDAMGLGL